MIDEKTMDIFQKVLIDAADETGTDIGDFLITVFSKLDQYRKDDVILIDQMIVDGYPIFAEEWMEYAFIKGLTIKETLNEIINDVGIAYLVLEDGTLYTYDKSEKKYEPYTWGWK